MILVGGWLAGMKHFSSVMAFYKLGVIVQRGEFRV